MPLASTNHRDSREKGVVVIIALVLYLCIWNVYRACELLEVSRILSTNIQYKNKVRSLINLSHCFNIILLVVSSDGFYKVTS